MLRTPSAMGAESPRADTQTPAAHPPRRAPQCRRAATRSHRRDTPVPDDAGDRSPRRAAIPPPASRRSSPGRRRVDRRATAPRRQGREPIGVAQGKRGGEAVVRDEGDIRGPHGVGRTGELEASFRGEHLPARVRLDMSRDQERQLESDSAVSRSRRFAHDELPTHELRPLARRVELQQLVCRDENFGRHASNVRTGSGHGETGLRAGVT